MLTAFTRRDFLRLLEALTVAGLLPSESSATQIPSTGNNVTSTSTLANSTTLQTISNSVGSGIRDLSAASNAISNGYSGGAQISVGPAHPEPYTPEQPETELEGYTEDDLPSNYMGFNPQTGSFFNVP